MIICPNCNHQNPESASQCEACYTPLPAMVTCANCGAGVQADASFCGQCGHSLTPQAESPAGTAPLPQTTPSSTSDLVEPDPLVAPIPVSPLPVSPIPVSPIPVSPSSATPPPPLPVESTSETMPAEIDIYSDPPITQPTAAVKAPQTQLQSLTARLLHIQTDTLIELSAGLNLLHIGKPNDRIPPDIDVSGFPESEIVSRVHANIRIEGDVYYIEDVGSSNGTYVNNLPLAAGNRHRLRPGDRIALGKGDKVSFIFQIA